ncbi:hypothetical protein ABNB59_04985 [Paenibacillus larvae]|uniref:DUF3899 domain-containing protein n=3 Tax=Paenibacillus larvae TaxID=1464 RepID=V9W830_9BACL|nr:hypothetical protein [Paenibacillus larvae]AHD07206.1 hypothetical protein ERIC2_c34760 [Paenibacillus larvae subsp. larvae DSM 25430]AQR79281.1 hypothetical protein BXP28_20735 [Paenibacillus larvae subsp. larvae]AQT85627.1 hypothetical protein B1222_16440 [Paenibacillus larvae subsp. pulvifaciens]AQZ47641.1 hypothetical protein B5S25_14720 [Paenibacillus larvae subsp. pulvifaciens]AVF23554.1 hypothetical protein ERICI_03815 [Paenibacillus larvae subsp. larvae]
MLRQISDSLFMISLIALMFSVVFNGIFFRGFSFKKKDDNPNEYVIPKKGKIIESQDKGLKRFIRSKLTYISLGGIALSIVISLI